MKNFFFNFFLMSFFLMTACTKEVRDTALDVLSGEDTLLSKMNLIDGATSSISLSSHTEGLGHQKKSYRLDGCLGAKHLETCDNITINGDIVMERYVPSPELGLSEEFAQLFGKKIQCNMNSKPNQVLETRTLMGGSIATPNEIEVTMPSGSPNVSNNTLSVPRNVPLRWNPDVNNRSVYILVFFNPQSVRNFRHRSARRKTAFHTVRDNGSFTIPASDFEGIPAGAYLEILVARGNTALVGATSNGMGSTGLMTYSMATIGASSGGGSCGDCIEVYP
jgi:hypothetical protein